MSSVQWFLAPYDFYPTVLAFCLLAAGWYGLGLIRRWAGGKATGVWRPLLYFLGVVLIYAALQTKIDYWSQHMFFVGRVQQIMVHYFAPFLIAMAAPGPVLSAALPEPFKRRILIPLSRTASGQYFRRIFSDPIILSVAFAGFMVLWLIPPIQFYAMLNVPLYDAKNWSMTISGLLFWGLVLDPRSPHTTHALGYGYRIAVLLAVMMTSAAVSAAIALSPDNIYPVYAVCGRLWPLSPMTDQRLGGMVALPAAILCIAAIAIVFLRMLDDEPKPAASSRYGGPTGVPLGVARE